MGLLTGAGVDNAVDYVACAAAVAVNPVAAAGRDGGRLKLYSFSAGDVDAAKHRADNPASMQLRRRIFFNRHTMPAGIHHAATRELQRTRTATGGTRAHHSRCPAAPNQR